jgi:hypothetical protein
MSTTLPFPMPLAEKYRPRAIAAFLGLDKPKRILAKFASNPYQSAWVFIGQPGTGKTTMALLWLKRSGPRSITYRHSSVVSQKSKMLFGSAGMFPRRADSISCSSIKPTRCPMRRSCTPSRNWTPLAFPPQTIFVFTCNATDDFESRFLSRTGQIEFSSYGLAAEATRLLESIRQLEANGASAPNFVRIVKESANDVRDALMFLELSS